MNEELRKLKPDESDSALEIALKHNKTQPIAYKGKWYVIGWLEKCLDTEVTSLFYHETKPTRDTKGNV